MWWCMQCQGMPLIYISIKYKQHKSKHHAYFRWRYCFLDISPSLSTFPITFAGPHHILRMKACTWAIVLAHSVTSKERWKTMQACRMKGHRRAAASMGGGTGRMGSRWQWLCPISTTEGGLKMATGPPRINSIQGDALSSRQRDTFLTTPPLFSQPPTSHHNTTGDAESIIWVLKSITLQ